MVSHFKSIDKDQCSTNTLDQEINVASNLSLKGADSQEPTCSADVKALVVPAMNLSVSETSRKNMEADTLDILPSGFSIEDDGLCYTKVDKEDNVKKIIIGDALRVIAKASNKTGGNQTLLVKFHEKTRGIDKEISLSIKDTSTNSRNGHNRFYAFLVSILELANADAKRV